MTEQRGLSTHPNSQLAPDYRCFDAGQGYVFFTAKCPRCDGRGYHHGFGEHGHDPDWCSECGGGQTVTKDAVTPWET